MCVWINKQNLTNTYICVTWNHGKTVFRKQKTEKIIRRQKHQKQKKKKNEG